MKQKKVEERKAASSVAKTGSKKSKEDLDEDPIAASLKERIAAGGVTSVVSKPAGAKTGVPSLGMKKAGMAKKTEE